ncbi:MAG: transaldolase [Phycisphaerae bacterium]|nr:MAG: fructose-6-phosphate aldolase [Planctomycetia bacterium]RIK67976.1 MAG: fructose-6-phosphate aldolase [Planctomycetota bacterium]GJQ27081.1 MAG: transaldolase [Phycisphaerae bacterium]
MKFFLDTANLDEIRAGAALGIVDGVTTNPSLVAKEGKDFKTLVGQICEIIPGPVSAEVVSTTCDAMVKEGRELSKIAENVIVKLPTIPEGVKALKILAAEGVKTNLTLVFQPIQALIVAKAGATYCSPFLGRLDDIGQDGMALIDDIRLIYDNYGFRTEILAASLRHPLHVVQAAKAGADIGTMPYGVFKQLLNHPLTDIGLERFLNDFKKLQAK